MRVLSLGAGVQSTTLFLMACEGEEPIDCAIFADTGWEPAGVYAHLDWLEAEGAKAGIPLHRVKAGNLREDALRSTVTAWMPLHLRNHDGTGGMLRRQCTKNYKIVPIRRKLRELGGGPKYPIEQLIGISLDEVRRMRDSDVKYIRNVFPLVDRRMTRAGCLAWLRARGYREPQKSSCIACPYHDNAHWRRMRDASPDDWQNAVEFDRAIRNRRHEHAEAFLHRSLVPLDMVDLRSEQERGQTEMDFDGCGVLCATGDAA